MSKNNKCEVFFIHNKKIVKEEDIVLYDREYKMITFDNGERILKRYNKKAKMWVVLEFKQDN